ncbi:hypothetical protein GCM10010297_33780 [Streptomyces malachitofuscus]|nr:hypothetical protein GCM10010297_33780 [Streptomyces malachitofuscus]
MRKHLRLRRLVVDGTVLRWTVRQRVRPAYDDCRLTLSFFTEGWRAGAGRRLSLVFAPGEHRIVSNTYFEAGTVMRLPDRADLNLHETGAARRLLDAAAPALDLRPAARDVEVDGWPYFDAVVDSSGPSPASASR